MIFRWYPSNLFVKYTVITTLVDFTNFCESQNSDILLYFLTKNSVKPFTKYTNDFTNYFDMPTNFGFNTVTAQCAQCGNHGNSLSHMCTFLTKIS